MNNMRNFLIKSLTVLVLFLVAGTVFASNGETLNIGGTVPLTLTLNVTKEADLDKLALNTSNSVTIVDVASITVASNASAGWELYIYSANGGKMLNADADEIAYTLTYATTESTAAAADTTPTTAGVVFASETDTSGDTTGDLNIKYTQSTAYPAGYYSDQLTMVLRAQ